MLSGTVGEGPDQGDSTRKVPGAVLGLKSSSH